MLELTIYGLIGLAAMLVTAFLSAFGDEFAPAREHPRSIESITHT